MSAYDLVHALLVVFGVGLVIFVHELGHYLAARWAGAKVETFSIGIGPRLFGWRRGDTMFQVAALPLGGYVKLAGEYPEPGRTARPGELGSMSVLHRFVYYSGGVVMNVIFALVVLPLVLFVGLEGLEPVLGDPSKGSPAWHERLAPGTRVLAANGRDPFDFVGLATEVALNGKKPLQLTIEAPGEAGPRVLAIQPEYDDDAGMYRLGVAPALDPAGRLVVSEDSAAAEAGLTKQDALLGVLGQPTWLAPREQLSRALTAGGPVTLRVRRQTVTDSGGPAEPEPEREVVVTPREKRAKGNRIVGVVPPQNWVHDLRRGPAGAPGPAQVLGLQKDDRIVSVGGRLIHRVTDFVDALVATEGPFEVVVARAGNEVRLASPALSLAQKLALDEDVYLDADRQSSRILAQPGRPAALAGVQDGDRVMTVNAVTTSSWDEVFEQVQAATSEGKPVAFELWRQHSRGEGATERESLALQIEPVFALELDYGLGLAMQRGVQRASGVGDAISKGFVASWHFLANTWLTLKKMLFTDEVSTKNLGGIITISVVSFHTANEGLAQLFFLLAIISVNLAILNILPIPILDGGHLLFLLIEWVKGSPVSERTLGYSQVIGLVLLMSLMIYVTYQDVVRWILRS